VLLFVVMLAAACATTTQGRSADDQTPAPTNQLTGIQVAPGEGRTTVTLSGTAKPAYVVFRMSDPQRLIVDLDRCTLAGVPAVADIKDGLISVITANQFDEKGKPIARVMIGFERNAEFVVEEQGSSVLLHLAHPSDYVAAATPAAPPADSATPAEPAPEAEPSPAVTATPSPVEPAPGPAAFACPESGEPVVLVKSSGKRSAGKLTAVKTEASKDGLALSFDASGKIVEGSYDVLRLCHPDRMVVDIYGLKNGLKTREMAGDGEYVRTVRLGAHADKLRVVLDLDKALPYANVEAGKRRLTVAMTAGETMKPADGPTPAPAASEAMAVAAAPVAAPAPVAEPEDVSAPISRAAVNVTGLEFKQLAQNSTIEIRLSGKAGYRLVETSKDQLVLELSGVALPEPLEQSLDTSEFDGPVTLVSSYVADPEARLVKVAVQLREAAPNRIEQDGNVLYWRFDRPAATAQAAGGKIKLDTSGATVIEYPADDSAGYAAAAAPVAQAVAGAEAGQRISLELKSTDILDVLRLIADVSKLNIITSDDVRGTITVRLLNVPWQQALDIILRSKGLGQERQGNIVRVAPLSVLQKEREMRIANEKAKRALEPLHVRLIPVSYSDAQKLTEKVKDLISSRGTVNFDDRTNVLIVTDIDEVLAKAEDLVSKLDLQTPQVMIEAKIVELDASSSWSAGIQWGGYYQMSEATGNSTGLVFPSSFGVAGAQTNTTSPGTPAPPNWIVNVPAPSEAAGGVGFTFGNVQNTANLSLRLTAFESVGKIKIVSSPRISTLDNSQATIKQGLQVPIITLSIDGLPVTKLVNANLELKVTPHITADGSIVMKLEITKQEPDFSRTNRLGDPAIIEKKAQTEVLVRTGETTVIGGIYTKKTSEVELGVPGLSKIPILGYLFKNHAESENKTELLIFVTPRIINRSQSSLAVE